MTLFVPELGVIEGFYGEPWSRESRLAMARWLPALGVGNYLYAPKADAVLRRRWREDWSDAQRSHLRSLGRACADAGLAFYVGLSPYALYTAYSSTDAAALRSKVSAIADLGVTGIALLFDDMPGDLEDLAPRQLEIIHDVASVLGETTLLVCPTFYSDDPVLDRVFGRRPANYLETLGAGLDPEIGLFWTGPRVCSEVIDRSHLAAVQDRCGQRLQLWDNYPVNDSKVRSQHLYLQPLTDRNGRDGDLLVGHWCNAMNQPALSLPALASLPALYGKVGPDREGVFTEAGLTPELLRACQPLATRTLDELAPAEHAELLGVATSHSMAARELRAWLAGEYAFDPACLTD